MVVCPIYLILYNPGTLYLNASYVPYNAPGNYIIMVEEGRSGVRETRAKRETLLASHI
jgi:hypothetical protein